MTKLPITIERLREAFDYDPITGVIRWRISRRGQARPGDIAGCKSNNYIAVKLDQQLLMAHRVAWALVNGRWPDGDVDHRDGDGSNNRYSNLREGTRALNMQNRQGPQVNSASGRLGVWRVKRNLKKPWKAQIVTNRRPKHLGYFATEDEAQDAYIAAKVALHPFQTLVQGVAR